MKWRVWYECDFCQATDEIVWQNGSFPRSAPCTRCGIGEMVMREKEIIQSAP